jgi:hypothetical protein
MPNEKKARIEIRFDPHRTNTLQLALQSYFTRRRFEYQMQGSSGRIVALATRRRVLVGSVESCFENKLDFIGDKGECPKTLSPPLAPFRGPESLKRVAWFMREKYLSSISDLAMAAKPIKAASRAVTTSG